MATCRYHGINFGWGRSLLLNQVRKGGETEGGTDHTSIKLGGGRKLFEVGGNQRGFTWATYEKI